MGQERHVEEKVMTKEDKAWIVAFVDEQITAVKTNGSTEEKMKEFIIDQIESVQHARRGLWECQRCGDKTKPAWYRVRFAPECSKCKGPTKFIRDIT